MSKQRGLTLQQYIECYNIKKQLKERSKEKQRQKTLQKSQTHLTLQGVDNSINQSSLNLRQSLNQSVYDKVDSRSRNLNRQLQEKIKDIKIECRGFIKNDKDFSMFLQMMDELMDMFRFQVMRIHKENMALFKVSENQLNAQNEKDQLSRSILQKSLNDQYVESKIQYQENAKPIRRDSQKKANQNRSNNHISSKERGKNDQKRDKLIYTNIPTISTVKSLPITSTQSILPMRQQQEKLIKDINSLNTNVKIKLNTEPVDKCYPEYNISFGSGFYNNNVEKKVPQQNKDQLFKDTSNNYNDGRVQKIIYIPKSPNKKQKQIHDNKLISSASKTPNKKVKSKTKPQKDSKFSTLRSSQYLPNIPNGQQLKLRRTNSKSKSKKLSINK